MIFCLIFMLRATPANVRNLVPRYQAEHKSTDPEKGGAIVFIFDQTAISSETHFVIDGFTLVNRIGGIIGFCRNIFWFLLFLTGLSKTIEFIMDYFNCLQQKNYS